MIRKYWKLLLITTLALLIPVLVGLILWNQLPEQIPTHWNAQGEIDGWSSKPFVVFGLTGIMLAIQWLCVLGAGADPKKGNHPEKVLQLALWISPLLSLVLYAVTYATALGKTVRIEVILPVLIGVILAVIGNYLPKCKQNYTIGIKIPWTLSSEENWNRTHRFAGRLWVACGLAIILTGFLGGTWLLLGIFLLMALAPMIYSYILYRKGI